MRRSGIQLAPGSSNRWIAAAGLVYLVAWVAGLLIEPSAPAPTASATEVASYYMAHRTATMVQTYVLNGVAGGALLVLAAALRRGLRRDGDAGSPLHDLLYAAGVAAGTVSLVQGAFGEVLVLNASTVAGESGAAVLFDLVNVMDTFKLMALSLFLGATSMLAYRTESLPRWVSGLGFAISPALIVGGLGFLVRSSALYGLLYLALPALLVWVVAVSLFAWRRGV